MVIWNVLGYYGIAIWCVSALRERCYTGSQFHVCIWHAVGVVWYFHTVRSCSSSFMICLKQFKICLSSHVNKKLNFQLLAQHQHRVYNFYVTIYSSPVCFHNCKRTRTACVWEKEWGMLYYSRVLLVSFFFSLRRHCFNMPIHFSLRTGAVHNCVFGRKCIGKRWCVVSYIYKRIIGTINNVYVCSTHTTNYVIWAEMLYSLLFSEHSFE